MAFDIDRFSQLTQRMDISDIDFARFRAYPLPEPVLRCLRYMHDVEHHTVCYLRDLLVTRAHRDPEIATFLTIWNYEEHWHGDAIGKVLAEHGEVANSDRVTSTRRSLGLKNQLQPIVSQLGSIISPHVVALFMAWGAINEWTTQVGYSRLNAHADHPVLDQLLRRIMRQEGRHIDFYMSQATKRLEGSRVAQRFVRQALRALWAPVGSGLMPEADVRFLITYLFGDKDGTTAADRIDRRIDSLPGLAGLSLVRRAVGRAAAIAC